MLTEECHLNPYLERHGIEVVDTDLGERIVQLRHEPPSHIVLPAIHIKKEEVGRHVPRVLWARRPVPPIRTIWPKRPAGTCARSSWPPTPGSRA